MLNPPDFKVENPGNEAPPDYRFILQNSPIGIFTSVPEGRLLSANRAFARMLGYLTPEELVSSITEISSQIYADPADRRKFLSLLDSRGEVNNHECRFRRLDGTEFWVSINALAVRDTNEAVSHYQGFVTDITQLKETGEALRESRELLDIAQRMARIGGWQWDVARRKMIWTNEAYRIHGLKPGEVDPGSPEHIQLSLACYDPEDRPVIQAAFERCATKGKPYSLEFPLTTADGRRIWIRTMARPVLKRGKVVKVLGNIMDITESKQAEEVLRESETKFRALFENAGDAVLLADEDGLIVDANPQAQELTGYSIKDLKGMHQTVLHPPEIKEQARSAFARGVQSSPWPCIQEFILLDSSGRHIPVEICSGGRFRHGDRWLHVGIFRDITERKRTEEALRESEIKYRSILGSIPDLMFINNLEGIYLDYHASDYSMLALKPEQFLGKGVTDVLPSPVAEKIVQGFKRTQESKQPVIIEYSLSIDNVLKYFEARITPMDDRRQLTLIRDITSRKLTEQTIIQTRKKVAAAHLRLLRVFDNIRAFIFVSDMKTHEILFANKYMKSTFGDVEGKPCWKVLRPEQTVSCEACKQKLVDDEGNPTGVYHHEYHNKKTGRWYDCQDSAISWINGEMAHFEMAVDITERKLDAEELKKSSRQLQKALAERDKFFSIIAHDLKSPLIGFLEFIRMLTESIEELSMEDIRRLAGDMKHAADNLYNLLENLLEWSVMQRDEADFLPFSCSLAAVVEQNIDLMRTFAMQKNIEFRCSVPETLLVYSDMPMLNMILRNLFSNAIKFSRSNGIVTVSATPRDSMVLVSVEDQGVGMNQNVLSSLFVLGQTQSRRGTAGEKGTGLGLLLCKEYVNKHGGEIWAESNPETGSVFHFTLPGAK